MKIIKSVILIVVCLFIFVDTSMAVMTVIKEGTTATDIPLRGDENGNLLTSLGTRLTSVQDSIQCLGNVAHDAADADACKYSENPCKYSKDTRN